MDSVLGYLRTVGPEMELVMEGRCSPVEVNCRLRFELSSGFALKDEAVGEFWAEGTRVAEDCLERTEGSDRLAMAVLVLSRREEKTP